MKPKNKVDNAENVIIDGNVILTAKRFREKYGGESKEGKSNRSAFHVIQPKYCKMLGIDPDSMLVVSVSAVWFPILIKRVEDSFAEMDGTLTLPLRIWQAHVKGYKKIISMAIMDYVGREMLNI